MLSKVWSRRELKSLEVQLKGGKKLEQIRIKGRTKPAIESAMYRHRLQIPSESNWSPAEVASLKSQWSAGKRRKEIVIEGRSHNAITRKRHELGLSEENKEWSDEEDIILCRGIHSGKLLKQIDLPGRSIQAKWSRASHFELQKKVKQNRMTFWDECELKSLRKQIESGVRRAVLAIPGKTKGQIEAKLCELKILVHTLKRGKFTLAEIESLQRQIDQGVSPHQCALLRRSKMQIRGYFEKNGVMLRTNRHWTKSELAALRRQAKEGPKLAEIAIKGRSTFSIRAKLGELGIFLVRRPWREDEIASLKRQLEKRIAIEKIKLPRKSGEKQRSVATIKRYARQQGLIAAAAAPRGTGWSEQELAQLRRLRKKELSAAAMKKKGYFATRSLDSISQQIRRLKLVDPEKSAKSREARRHGNEIKTDLDSFIIDHGLSMPAEKIAAKFGVSRSAVKSRGKKLGVCLSWKDAIKLSDSRFKQRYGC